MLLVKAMDEGPVISVGVYTFKGDETTPQLTNSLIDLSTALLRDSLEKYMNGTIKPTPQDKVAESLGLDPTPTYSRKLVKEDGLIDWTKPASLLTREVRAYVGWPKSRVRLGSVDVIITKALAVDEDVQNTNIGSIYTDDAKNLFVTCAEGSMQIIKLKPAGKKEMDIQAFLAGYKHKLGL